MQTCLASAEARMRGIMPSSRQRVVSGLDSLGGETSFSAFLVLSVNLPNNVEQGLLMQVMLILSTLGGNNRVMRFLTGRRP